MKCSQSVERIEMQEKLKETMDWLHEQSDDAESYMFWNRREAVEYVFCY